MFISQEIGPGACCWHVLPSDSGAGHQKLLDVASMACLARRLGGWTPQNYSMLTHVKTRGKKNSTLCAMTFGSFIPNLGIWIQGSGAAGHVSSTAYFSKFWKIKTRRLKTDLTLSLILRFNLRLEGYSYGARVHRTPYKRRLSGLEHLTASIQPEVLGRSLEELDGALEVLEDDFISTRACSTRLRRARGLVRPGPTGLCTPHRCEEDSEYTEGRKKPDSS